MILSKKVLFSGSLVAALLFSSQAIANANTNINLLDEIEITETTLDANKNIPIKPNASMSFVRWEKGMVKVTSGTHPIYNNSVTPIGDNYLVNESFYYDSIYTYHYYSQAQYNFASYISFSGARRYVLISSDTGLGTKPVPGLTVTKL